MWNPKGTNSNESPIPIKDDSVMIMQWTKSLVASDDTLGKQ